MSIAQYSQIANVIASPDFRKTGNYFDDPFSHTANMHDDDDKNGGPNHLRAWMEHRGVKGIELARRLGGNVTPGMVSDLMNSKRALSAKWLRRIAPLLDTTPGMLLDHDPDTIDNDIVEMWMSGSARQRHQLSEIAKTILKTDSDEKFVAGGK